MADVYEKNLGSKSSLTTSDYIRVVGSDNVSYKQGMASVMGAMGLGTTIPNGTDLNTLTLPANGRSLKIYYGNDITQMTNKPSAVSNAWPFCIELIPIGASASYTKQILHMYGTLEVPDSAYTRVQTYSSGSVVWSDWVKMPTRAEIDALTNAQASHSLSANNTVTITISKYQCAGTLYGAVNNNLGFEYAFGNGYLAPIKTATGVTVTLGSDYKTITVTNSTTTNGWVGMAVTNWATVTMS